MTWTTPNYRTSGEVPLDVLNGEVIDNILHLLAGFEAVATEWSRPAPTFSVTPVEFVLDEVVTPAKWNQRIVDSIVSLRTWATATADAFDVAISLPDPPTTRPSGEVTSDTYNDEIIDNLLGLKDALDEFENLGVGVALVGVATIGHASTAVTVTAPARAAGDYLSVVTQQGTSSSTPSGWTNHTGSTDNHFTRTADATTTDNFGPIGGGGTTNRASMAVLRSIGSVWTRGALQIGTTTVAVPGLTAVGAGVEVIEVQAGQQSGSAAPTISTPSGFTLLGTTTGSYTGGWVRVSVFSRVVAGAGAIGSTNVSSALGSGGSSLFVSAVRVAVSQ